MGISKGNCSLVHSLATCRRARETIAELAWEIPRDRRFSAAMHTEELDRQAESRGSRGRRARRCDLAVRTLSIVLLLLRTRPVVLVDMGGRVARLRLLVVAALVEDLWQVGSVDLPELLVIIQSSAEVPVLTCRTKTNS